MWDLSRRWINWNIWDEPPSIISQMKANMTDEIEAAKKILLIDESIVWLVNETNQTVFTTIEELEFNDLKALHSDLIWKRDKVIELLEITSNPDKRNKLYSSEEINLFLQSRSDYCELLVNWKLDEKLGNKKSNALALLFLFFS